MSELFMIVKQSNGQEQRVQAKTGSPAMLKVQAGSLLHLELDGAVQSAGQALDTAKVIAVHAAVAKALGLSGVDLVRDTVQATINPDGSSNVAASNSYGKVLAALDGMAEIYGSIDATVAKLSSGFSSEDALNATMKTALVQGALLAQGQSSTQAGLASAIQGLTGADISKLVMPA